MFYMYWTLIRLLYFKYFCTYKYMYVLVFWLNNEQYLKVCTSIFGL